MKQTTLDPYLSISRKYPRKGPGFFDLSYEVRHRIYLLTGVVRQCPVDLNKSKTTDKEDGIISPEPKLYQCVVAKTLGRDCDCRPNSVRRPPSGIYCPIPSQLLLTSSLVSKEVTAILYSKNTFKISYFGLGGFSALGRLRPSTIALLRFLQVTINSLGACECEQYETDMPCYCERHSSETLSCIHSRNHKYLLQSWQRTCQQLSYVPDSCLRLCLICDTTDWEITSTILQQLEYLPTLAACAIRLLPFPNRYFDKKLYPLGLDVALQVTGRANARHRILFRYNKLPHEVQVRILEHTDLVAPYNLQWVPGRGLVAKDNREGKNHCWVCLTMKETCCSRIKFGTFIRQCSCWQYPASLFLVSRSVHFEATRIFFSRNYFIVASGFGIFTPELRLEQTTLCLFPAKAVRYLRSIQFILFWVGQHNWTRNRDDLQRWKRTIEIIRRLGDPRQLCITILYTFHDKERTMQVKNTLGWNSSGRSYQHLVGALSMLPGLKDFFIYAVWNSREFNALRFRDEWEKSLEREVMGEEYDSGLRGKPGHLSRTSDDELRWSLDLCYNNHFA